MQRRGFLQTVFGGALTAVAAVYSPNLKAVVPTPRKPKYPHWGNPAFQYESMTGEKFHKAMITAMEKMVWQAPVGESDLIRAIETKRQQYWEALSAKYEDCLWSSTNTNETDGTHYRYRFEYYC